MDKFVTIDHFDQFRQTLVNKRLNDAEQEVYMIDVQNFFTWIRQDKKIG